MHTGHSTTKARLASRDSADEHRDARTALIAVIVSAMIAGLFGVLTKLTPEGYMRYLVPYQGGIVTQSTPDKICQVVRFWVPDTLSSDTAGSRPLPLIVEDLNKSVTYSFGGWTRWAVSGQWRDPYTNSVTKEDGHLYEVGMESCEDAEVKKLYEITSRFVRVEMHQSALYFAATRFEKPK